MKKTEIDWTKNQSTAIDLLRFPLAIAVIFIHMNPLTFSLPEADFPMLSGRGVLNVIGITMSHVLTRIAVPTFFMISGYLFFYNFRNFTWKGYKNKMRSRIKTLIIPYIAWNILTFGIVILMQIRQVLLCRNSWQSVLAYIQENSLNIFLNCKVFDNTENLLGWAIYNTGPIDLPLWFLRDLIVVSILTPLIYWFVKKTKVWGVLVLLAAYLTRIWVLTPGFSIRACFFFTLGAYFAINGKNLIKFARRYSIIFVSISAVVFPICVYFDGMMTITGGNILQFYIVPTVFVALAVASVSVERYNIKASPLLVKSCFFIYASHAAPIFILWSPINFASGIIHHIIPGSSGLEEMVCYMAAPFLAAVICVSLYYALSRYIPKASAPLTAGR